jgi:hypothetical protein
MSTGETGFRSFKDESVGFREMKSMSDEGEAIRPEVIFKKFLWHNTLEAGEAIERFTTWTITGIAVVTGLLIGNLDSVAKIVSLCCIRTAIIMLTISLLAGAISKQIGVVVATGLNNFRKIQGKLDSEFFKDLMDRMTIAPSDLGKELAEPFCWPISSWMRKACERALVDPLDPEKRLVKLLCMQAFFNLVHQFLAFIALCVIAIGIGGGR